MSEMRDFYKNKKVLVIGHTGFKGSWLSQTLLNFGAEVIGISLAPHTKPSLFEVLQLENRIKNYFCDVRDIEKLKEVFEKEKPEIVFHLAAQALVLESYKNPLLTISTNTLGTTNVMETLRQVGCVKSAVIITTDKVYENKDWVYPYRENDSLGGYDPYSASKAAADIIVNSYIQSYFNPKDFKNKHNTLVAIARAGNVIGGGDWNAYRLVPDIIRCIFEGDGKVIIRSPQAIRPWEHVLEPLSGYLLLGKGLYEENLNLSTSWNFGPLDDSFRTVSELTDEAIKILGKGEVDIQLEPSKHETHILKLDVSKAHTLLSWKSRLNFLENLRYTFDWYNNYYGKKENEVEFTNRQIEEFFNKKI